jgi:hypothetical protein
MNLELTLREIEIIRSALRQQEEQHKRNDFKHLMVEATELRSKISDIMLDNRVVVG